MQIYRFNPITEENSVVGFYNPTTEFESNLHFIQIALKPPFTSTHETPAHSARRTHSLIY